MNPRPPKAPQNCEVGSEGPMAEGVPHHPSFLGHGVCGFRGYEQGFRGLGFMCLAV